MCREKRKLPIGIENFEQIIKDDFYYVDKIGRASCRERVFRAV